MSSRWICISCGGKDCCELLTEYDDEPTCCPYHANTLPVWERVEEEEKEDGER